MFQPNGTKLLLNTVDARYIEHGLYRTFAISNKFLSPLSFAHDFFVFYAGYIELRYIEHFAISNDFSGPLP